MEEHTLRVLEFNKVLSRLESQAASALGREVAGLTYPTTDLEVAQRKQKETTEARDILNYEANIPLGGIEDIRHYVERATVESILQPHELLSVLTTLQSSRRLGQFLVKLKLKYPLLGDLGSEVEPFEAVEASIAGAISQSGEVMDSASPTLARVRSELRTTQSRLMEKLNSYISGSQYRTIIQEPVVTLRNERYCIPIKAEHKGQFPGIVHDSSASGATLFVEPVPVVELGNRRKQLAIKEREEIEKVLMELSGKVGAVGERILAVLNVVGMIDCITARAKLSILQEATEPRLNDLGQIDLIMARHPLLEGNVVPIDVSLGKRFNALLITGPNTGGKTVSLKTVGLFALMAACGLHVPAKPGTEVAIFQTIFADIGDEQSIEQSLSTFSSHMNNIVRITRGASKNALVLLDEVGAGTDPGEGAALAKAVLDYLLNKGAKIIATTHYGELKEFAYLRDGIENASVEFDLRSLRPTYRLMIGIPGSSNAFSIAGRLGLDPVIIESAKENLTSHTENTDELIRRIEESHRIASEQRIVAERTSSETEQLRKRYEEQLRRLETDKQKVESKVRVEVESVIDEYAQKLNETLQQLAIQKKDSKRAQDLKKKAERIIDSMEQRTVKTLPEPFKEEALDIDAALKPGTRVRIANVNQDGEIVEPPQAGKVVVQLGAMRVTVPISSLRKPKTEAKAEPREQATHTKIAIEKAQAINSEISLRGMRAEAALFELDKYLDDAMAAGVDQVRIIHGKGTGTLRNLVWDYLRSHPGVSSYKLAEPNEGGSGATVVRMKR